jgi:uncharacterized protein (TIGR00251 family)
MMLEVGQRREPVRCPSVGEALVDPVTEIDGGVAIAVHAQPGAGRCQLNGRHGDTLRVKVGAPPVDGRANDALVAFLAEILGLPRRAVTLERGSTSRFKRISAVGISVTEARTRLGLSPP